ncbi:hypothetical protein K438DRAFT_1953784 [Mycena galopus ATCC 62051]|nr:hypothetical protein K438DRAFT_1953784 [Mycena galopus ATCC 62051]
MPHLNVVMNKAVAAKIADTGYRLCLPFQSDDWPRCFRKTHSEHIKCALLEFFHQVGISAFSHAIFLLLLPELREKPTGYSQAIQGCITSHKTLQLVVEKIDPRLVSGIKRVDGGFLAFVGMTWITTAGDTRGLLNWLGPIFDPILHVAGEAYMNEHNSRKDIIDAFTRADLLFLMKLYELLSKTPPPPSIASSPISSPENDRRMSVSPPFRLETVEDDPSKHFVPAVSPTTFDLVLDIVPDGAVLSDTYELFLKAEEKKNRITLASASYPLDPQSTEEGMRYPLEDFLNLSPEGVQSLNSPALSPLKFRLTSGFAMLANLAQHAAPENRENLVPMLEHFGSLEPAFVHEPDRPKRTNVVASRSGAKAARSTSGRSPLTPNNRME